MADMEWPPSQSTRSRDAGPGGKEEDAAATEKRRRKVVVLVRVTFPAPYAGTGRVLGHELDTLEQDQQTRCDQELSEDSHESYWERRTGNWKRGCMTCRSTGAHKKPKTNPTRIARPSFERKRRKTQENVQVNAEARKENNELRLKKRHLERLGLGLYFRRTEEDSSSRGRKPGKLTGPRAYVPHKQRRDGRTPADHPVALMYELKHEDISDEFSRLLVELQHRDLTPEDYETLLRLDEKVAPKTVTESALSSFETLTLESSSNLVGQPCSICMEVYRVSQRVKTLPCHHSFHCSCIDTWLSSASLICPLDGIPVHS